MKLNKIINHIIKNRLEYQSQLFEIKKTIDSNEGIIVIGLLVFQTQ